MKYDYSKLRGRIIEMFGTCGKFAEALGCSRQAVSNLLLGRSEFTIKTMESWRAALNISAEDIGLYFFARKVDK